MNEPKVDPQDLTLLDEFERNAEVVVGILQSSLTRIAKWNKDLPKTDLRLIAQRTREDVIKIVESFHPFADAFPQILRFLTTYIPKFKSKVEDEYSNINDKIQEIVRKCSHYPYPSEQPLYIEMCGLRHEIENLSQDLRFCVKIAREKLAAGTQPASGKAGDENKSAKEKQEGALEPKPPEILQKLLWLKQHGKKYWKLILLAMAILLILSIFAKLDLFNKIYTLIKNIHF